MERGRAQTQGSEGLAKASGRNLLAFSCTLLAQFVTIPLVVRWIGMDAFGVASLVISLTAPLTATGTALAQSATREMAVRMGRGDDVGMVKAEESTRALCLIVCAAGAVLIAGLGGPLVQAIGGHDYARSTSWSLYAWAAIGWVGQQATLLNQGYCAAAQDFGRMARVGAIAALLTTLITLGLTLLRPDATGYMAGFSLSWVSTWLCWIIYTRRSGDRRRRVRLHRAALPSLLHFSKWQSAAQLAGVAGNQVDRYMLAAMMPASVVGQYSTTKRLQEAVSIGVIKLTEVLFPYFGATSEDSRESRRSFFITASWLVGTLSVAALGPIFPLSDAILLLWAGPEAAAGGASLLQILILGGMLGCGSNVFTYCAMGLGLSATVARLVWIYSVLTVLASVALLWWWGATAAGVGLLIASAVRLAIAMAWTRKYLFEELAWGTLMTSMLLPLVAGITVSVILAETKIGVGLRWWEILLLYPLAALIIALVSTGLALATPPGRRLLSTIKAQKRYL